MIVADTNLISYLFIDGEYTQAARAVLQQDPLWAAPILWRAEFANVLTLHIRHAEMSLDGAKKRMGQAQKILQTREYSLNQESVLELTAKSNISAYDAQFVLLAQKLEIPLISYDKKLLKEFPQASQKPEDFLR